MDERVGRSDALAGALEARSATLETNSVVLEATHARWNATSGRVLSRSGGAGPSSGLREWLVFRIRHDDAGKKQTRPEVAFHLP